MQLAQNRQSFTVQVGNLCHLCCLIPFWKVLLPVASVWTWSLTLCKPLFLPWLASHSWSFGGVNRIPKGKKWDHAESLCYFPADSQPAALLPRCACISMLKPTPAGYSSAVFCWLPYESNSVVQPLDAIERLALCFDTATERPDRETLWGQLSISAQQRVGFSQFVCTQCNTVQRSHWSVEWLYFIDTLFLDICFSQTVRLVSQWVYLLSIFTHHRQVSNVFKSSFIPFDSFAGHTTGCVCLHLGL